MEKNLYIVSLGCAKNLVDSEVLAGELLSAGCRLVFEPRYADLYLINTCAFLPSAREEAFDAIRRAQSWKRRKEGRRIAVAGCLCQYDTAVRADFPLVDRWLAVNEIPQAAKILLKEPMKKPTVKKQTLPTFLADGTQPKLQLTSPHLGYLKICDGCNNCCSYCAIPQLRGHLRSRTRQSVLDEAKQLIDNGVKELVVIAQDITAFGAERHEKNGVATLLNQLNALAGEFKIRLLYTHPAHYTQAFIDAVASGGHILPYLDIPLQHISDRILTAMNRHVTQKRTEELLDQLRSSIPGLVLRTTFITGLPGETETEFSELEDFVRRCRFERCGFFHYAPEPGTPASIMAGQIPQRVKIARMRRLMEIQQEILAEHQKSLLGTEETAVVDGIASDGTVIGRTRFDAPEIDCVTLIRGRGAKKLCAGDLCRIVITGTDGPDTIGSLKGVKK